MIQKIEKISRLNIPTCYILSGLIFVAIFTKGLFWGFSRTGKNKKYWIIKIKYLKLLDLQNKEVLLF